MHSKRIVKPLYKVKNAAAAPHKPKVVIHKRQVSSHDEELSSDRPPPRGPSQKRSKSEHVAPEEVSDGGTSERKAEVVEIDQSEEEVSMTASECHGNQFHDSHYNLGRWPGATASQ
jgi:hypothetical protein